MSFSFIQKLERRLVCIFFSLLEVVRGVGDILRVRFKLWYPSGYVQLQVTK